MSAFHHVGCTGASTDVMVDSLGVNRNSVRGELGGKSVWFSKALELDQQQVINALRGAAKRGGGGKSRMTLPS